MNRAMYRLWLLPVVFLLSSCMMAPGSNIDEDAWGSGAAGFFDGEGTWFPGFGDDGRQPELQPLVNIVPITEEVAAQRGPSRARDSDAGQVPARMPGSLRREIDNYEYRIGKGDILSITVYEHPELTNPFGSQRDPEEAGNIVQSNGSIFYPYIGEVEVEGLTTNQVREIIAERLTEYFTDPQVDVKVISYRAKRAYVTGQVAEPGPQPINNVPLTVMDAISRAGGITENANWHQALLARDGEETRISLHEMFNNGHLGQNRLLRNGDVLHVPQLGEQQVFVLGELNDVNVLPMGNIRMSLTEALTRAGGLNQVTSDASGIFVIRQAGDNAQEMATVYQLNVRNAVNFVVGTRFMLEPMDIVYVTTAPVTRWNRVISQIMPSVTAILTTERLAE